MSEYWDDLTDHEYRGAYQGRPACCSEPEENHLTSWARNGLEETILDSFSAANIDGYGSEGAGWDLGIFAKTLIEAGWTPPKEES